MSARDGSEYRTFVIAGGAPPASDVGSEHAALATHRRLTSATAAARRGDGA
ncbi:hypothetical protein ABZ953_36440 [Streptomyces sp. NPDC046465]|uniref:hypothetical protein n=1 Tax=Streptomyces sp. NPDC046465 TaxID=3155810 RepID=UPI0033EBF5F3